MKLYTKTGDNGMTSLMNHVAVSKADERIELLGAIDELSAHIGHAKLLVCEKGNARLSRIQGELMGIMAGIADPKNPDYKVKEEQIEALERNIDKMESSFPRQKKFVLYGGCEVSARFDLARAVARRAERCFIRVKNRYGADPGALKYMNRLSDYLYISARMLDYQNLPEEASGQTPQSEISEDDVKEIVLNVIRNLSEQNK